MASGGSPNPRNHPKSPQSIPLQDLSRPPDDASFDAAERGHKRARSLLSGGAGPASSYGSRYERLEDTSPSPKDRNPFDASLHQLPVPITVEDHDAQLDSPVDPAAFQTALAFAMPGAHYEAPTIGRPISLDSNFDLSPYTHPYLESSDAYFDHAESDQVPLTDSHYLQPISGAEPTATIPQSHDRTSFQSIHLRTPTPESRPQNSRLGADLAGVEQSHSRSRSYGNTLSPAGPRVARSPSSVSPISRAGSLVRAMSQRVVNFSNDDEPPEEMFPKQASINIADQPNDGSSTSTIQQDTAYHPGISRTVEKGTPTIFTGPPRDPWPAVNPFKGKSLGIFSPTNPFRMKLCEILVRPITEIIILALILLQTILLAIQASTDGYQNPHFHPWGETPIDYVLLCLFVIYTLEIAARTIVSGFFFNPSEHSTRDQQKSLAAAISQRYQQVFGPQRHASVRRPREQENPTFSSSIVRSITSMQKTNMPQTVEEQQRNQLARRAFMRHSMNRIDFVAVVAYWIAFFLQVGGVEKSMHIYVFRMLSCLRLLRLLWITKGTAIILKSLKKAAPSLVNVSFLIGFFWLLFAVIGVQAFKSSFRRQCVWIDPLGQNNYTNNFTLCGGHLNNDSSVPTALAPLPWVYADGTYGAQFAKGFLCPRGSLCVEQQSLYNGTVSFDNIINSLELVFVTMSANTFTDLMYYTTNSDYLAGALFFAAGIVIMMLWLTNLLIAVITSSFQVIREESKKSAFTSMQQTQHAAEEEDLLLRRPSTLKRWYDSTFWFWIFVISFGLGCQAARSASMSNFRTQFISATETVVTLLLLVEVLLRIAADWRQFHRRYRNLFDAGLAVITAVILLPPIRNSGQPYAWLTVFQILRIYRVVWAVPMTRKLIALVLGNAMGIGNLVLFVFLITFLVAILAVQLFRGEIPPYDVNGVIIRTTFFSLWNSFLGMYQILSSENWTNVMYNVTAYDNYLNIAWIGATFLISWFILAFFILVNMFIAVIQENFDVSEDEKRLQQVKAFLQKKESSSTFTSTLTLSTIFRFGRPRRVRDAFDYGQAAMEMLLKETVVKDFLDEENYSPFPNPASDSTPGLHNAPDVNQGYLRSLWGKFISRVWNRDPNPFYSNIHFVGTKQTLNPRDMAKEVVTATTQRKKAQRDYVNRHPTYNTSLFIFKPTNPIRWFCQKIVGPGRGSERFDGVEPNRVVWYCFSAFIYAAILCMVILACITTPLYQKIYFQTHTFAIKNWFVWTDMAFAAIFTSEAIIKIVADGAIWTPNAYFRSLWGCIDGLVLVTLWINVITAFMNEGPVSRGVGAFKALRALRLLNISDSARDTFHSVVFVGGWRVISAALVSLFLLIPFAIYGVNLFNGQMMSCNDNSGSIINLSDCVGEWNSTPFSNNWNIPAPRVASNPYYDFDNFGGALFILFQIVSQEGWIDVMWSAQSINGRGLQPSYFANQGNAVFFVVFNLMATVFILTLFISVFMRTYTEQTGVAYLTAEQRSWLELEKSLRQVAPSKRPFNKNNSRFQNWCYKRASKKRGKWHRAVTLILVLHLILLMSEYYPEPVWWTRTRDYIFLVFTGFYIINIIIRIIGLSWARFRRSSWDLFSLLAVSGTLITTTLLLTKYSSVPYYQAHKIFLVLMTLLLIPRNNALDQLFKTAAASLTNIGNLMATWFVMFLVYAIAMTQSFSLTRFGSLETNNLNFRDVGRAMIVLFRMSVGESWNQIMEDYATIAPPMCVEVENFFDSDCGSAAWARGLFISWNILSMYIFVSLFVSLIYESFSYVYQRSSGLSVVTREETRRFKQAWATFDPDGTGYISKEAFPRLLAELSGVFAMRIYDEEDSVRRILEDVQMAPTSRSTSIATVSGAAGIDLEKLNARIAKIDRNKVRARRHKFKLFYGDIMVSADPLNGISFTNVLMTIAHYNIISDNKSLKLDDYLRRKAKLQRVEEELRRRIVVNFFDTMLWSKRFRRHLNRHNSARMIDIPQFEVPEIIVEEDEDGDPSRPEDRVSPMLSATDVADHRTSFRENFGLDTRPRRGTDASWHGSGSALSSPSRSPRLSPHRPTLSGHNFDVSAPGSPRHSRHGSNVSAENVLEAFSESSWAESLRRSFSMRRRHGDHHD